MTNDRMITKKWYLTLVAGYFLLLCGLSSARYIAMDVSLINGSIPISTQVLCFAATVAAALYFFRPMIGCVALSVISLYGLLLSARAADAKGVVFYGIVLAVLIIPIMSFLRGKLR